VSFARNRFPCARPSFAIKLLKPVAVACALLALSGCSSLPFYRFKKAVQPPSLPKKFGTILRVDAPHGFVLIQKDSSTVLPEWDNPESALILHSSDPLNPNARLRLSSESRKNLVIADILEGHPMLGDSVFTPPPNAKPVPPTQATEETPQNTQSPVVAELNPLIPSIQEG
jgi:hypothetical protein